MATTDRGAARLPTTATDPDSNRASRSAWLNRTVAAGAGAVAVLVVREGAR
jgi:hypothetical protein